VGVIYCGMKILARQIHTLEVKIFLGGGGHCILMGWPPGALKSYGGWPRNQKMTDPTVYGILTEIFKAYSILKRSLFYSDNPLIFSERKYLKIIFII
jgi:hypothetical protein